MRFLRTAILAIGFMSLSLAACGGKDKGAEEPAAATDPAANPCGATPAEGTDPCAGTPAEGATDPCAGGEGATDPCAGGEGGE